MRALAVFSKSVRQQLRDRIGFALTVLTAPAFVLVYWAFFSGTPPGPSIVVVDGGQPLLMAALETQLTVHVVEDRAALDAAVLSGDASAGVVIPSQLIGGTITIVGDETSPQFHAAGSLVERGVLRYLKAISGVGVPFETKLESLSGAANRTLFDLYVPGLLVFATIMLIFSAAMMVAREVESGTLERLRLTPVTSLDLLSGMSAWQLCVGALSVALTFALAKALGWTPVGRVSLVFGGAMLACVASIGIGMVVAALSPSVHRAFLIASAVMFLLVLFSGVVFPRPTLRILDVLPTTHLRLLLAGRGSGAHLGALTGLAVLYFGLGVVLFQRRHLK